MNSELKRLTSLLDQFRSLSSIKTLKLAEVELSSVAQEVIRLHTSAWLEQGVRVVSRFSGNLHFQGDKEKLQQVLLNLCKNAVEAMPNGGTLTLLGYNRGEHIVLEVTDNGTGIAHGIDVFGLFTSSKPKGAGLGLYIVQKIAEAHHGNISYTSDPGNATTFRLTLPIKARSEKAPS